MRISFDLDDTLICYDPAVPCEPNRVPKLLRFWFEEPLRKGSVELMQGLTTQGHSLWIYTTSARTPHQVKKWFKFYGVKIEAVVNQEIHDKHVGRSPHVKYVSKYPPAFDIDLHIDDLDGVGLEGEENNFKVVVVSMYDENWVAKVIAAVNQINSKSPTK